MIKIARPTFGAHADRFQNEFFRTVASGDFTKPRFIDISEFPFVKTVKVARINVPVSFDNKLDSAMSV